MDLDALPSQISRSRACFVQGWQFRANASLHKHAAQIRQIFTPAAEFREHLDRYLAANITPGQLLVGVHIRHGDYRTFENGRYFYTLDQYAQVMQNILQLLGPENVTFMISSNVAVPAQALNMPQYTLVSAPGHELLDLYALARCHYIAGPPSTYSMWASFYGEVPLYMIREPDRPFTLAEFKIQESF
jgi:hypothetical protein